MALMLADLKAYDVIIFNIIILNIMVVNSIIFIVIIIIILILNISIRCQALSDIIVFTASTLFGVSCQDNLIRCIFWGVVLAPRLLRKLHPGCIRIAEVDRRDDPPYQLLVDLQPVDYAAALWNSSLMRVRRCLSRSLLAVMAETATGSLS